MFPLFLLATRTAALPSDPHASLAAPAAIQLTQPPPRATLRKLQSQRDPPSPGRTTCSSANESLRTPPVIRQRLPQQQAVTFPARPARARRPVAHPAPCEFQCLAYGVPRCKP